jgi:hypothetical protein
VNNPIGDDGAELRRLAEDHAGQAPWKWWGPYLGARQWGTVREDYSATGDAWEYFPHDQARSRAYRWGEDGLGGICDRWQHLCFALALWNGRDPILKERLFGLTNTEGNHGEDVKEYWWPLDGTPTHSWMRWLYKYPQAAFPYGQLVEENHNRGRDQREFELVDTGVFDDGRYFDVELSYAKAGPEDLCIRITAHNRGPDPAPLHVLPSLWFRNTWAWGRDHRKPRLTADDDTTVEAAHVLTTRWLAAQPGGTLLFCENETNAKRLWGAEPETAYPKDGINDHVVGGAATVNPARTGTKCAAWYRFDVPAGESVEVRLRLADSPPAIGSLDEPFSAVLRDREAEADRFYERLVPGPATPEARAVQRRALAGLLWNKKHYRYDVREWLEGDPGQPLPPAARRRGRNSGWRHLNNADIVSLPDEWEYPWYAAWDLAFHMVPMALVDPDFAKSQLILFCREWYMHPNGQLPAYEWSFGDVNPPVHAWSAWQVFKIDAARSGVKDHDFLERVFHKLLIDFAWWVNRKDAYGQNIFEGGFLGLDNVGFFDRSAPLPGGGRLEQSDATSWMAMFCLNMLAIALELAHHDRTYEDVATKFFEHFLAIAHSANHRGMHSHDDDDDMSLWDEDDQFFYDVLAVGDQRIPLRVRSVVGLIPLFAGETVEPDVLASLPDFRSHMEWFIKNRPTLCDNVFSLAEAGMGERRLLSLLQPAQLRQILRRVLDESEFLSPHGVRSLSRAHRDHPVRLDLDGQSFEIAYQPGESDSGLFGGNSNWRGPLWFPINYLLVQALREFHHYFGDEFTVECPTGSGRLLHLGEVADEVSRRLVSLFLPGPAGRPVNGGVPLFDADPSWRDQVTFAEYFHGDDGRGLGATHQTGWTALVANLIAEAALSGGSDADGLRRGPTGGTGGTGA